MYVVLNRIYIDWFTLSFVFSFHGGVYLRKSRVRRKIAIFYEPANLGLRNKSDTKHCLPHEEYLLGSVAAISFNPSSADACVMGAMFA